MNVFCASRALQKLPFLLGDVGSLGGYAETWKAKGVVASVEMMKMFLFVPPSEARNSLGRR